MKVDIFKILLVFIVLALSGCIPHAVPPAKSRPFEPINNSMPSPAYEQKGLLLNDGRVLLYEGHSEQTLNAVLMLYDPIKQSFNLIPQPLCPHHFGSYTKLKTGEILIAGDASSQDGCQQSAELYIPKLNQYLKVGDLKFPRANHSAFLLPDGQVLIIGGRSGYSFPFKRDGKIVSIPVKKENKVELYNPNTKEFTVIDSPSTISEMWWPAYGGIVSDGNLLVLYNRHIKFNPLNNSKTAEVGALIYKPDKSEWSYLTRVPIKGLIKQVIIQEQNNLLLFCDNEAGKTEVLSYSPKRPNNITTKLLLSDARFISCVSLDDGKNILIVYENLRNTETRRKRKPEIGLLSTSSWEFVHIGTTQETSFGVGVTPISKNKVLFSGGALEPNLLTNKAEIFSSN